MTSSSNKKFSWAAIVFVAIFFAAVYSCNSNAPATQTPTTDSTSKSATDTTGKGGETPTPKNLNDQQDGTTVPPNQGAGETTPKATN